MSLVIVDTGCANLSSVAFAFDRLGAKARISDIPEVITSASHVVLPGVGAAPYAMARINDKNLVPTLQSLTQPVLGICLGMQLLYERLYEGQTVTQGLGLVPGEVTRLDTKGAPAPHMGWNQLEVQSESALLSGITDADYAYFVHSYAAPMSVHTLASCTYGQSFSAIIQNKNVYGCQFHPERSSQTGARILQNFLDINA